MGALYNLLSAVFAQDNETPGIAGDTGAFQGQLFMVLQWIFIGVGAVIVPFAIYLGFRLANASDEGKRREAKVRFMNVVATFFIILILVIIMMTQTFGMRIGDGPGHQQDPGWDDGIIGLPNLPNVPPGQPPTPSPPGQTTPPPEPNAGNGGVFLDAGHGGADPGAVGFGRRESDDNLDLVLRIGSILQSFQIPVIYYRRGNYRSVVPDVGTAAARDASLRERASRANIANVSLFVSIHRNGNNNASAHGVDTFVRAGASQTERNNAQRVHNAMWEAWRIVRPNICSICNRGLKNDTQTNAGSLHVLRNTNASAMLLEVGFITNSLDNTVFEANDHVHRIANAIAQAIRLIVGGDLLG